MESRLGILIVRCSWKRGTDGGKKNRSRVRGIDQSLADTITTGQRLGNQAGSALVELLFNDPSHQDPNGPVAEQLASDRCYEKAGFERQGTVTTPDGPAVYMVQTRQAFEERTRSVA